MNCTHTATDIRLMPPGNTHYAKEECVTCGRFIKWLPHPETIKRQEEYARRVKLLQSNPQDEWTKAFLETFPKKPSPKQAEILNKKWEEQSKK